jgi:LEA14-like dessication related protein
MNIAPGMRAPCVAVVLLLAGCATMAPHFERPRLSLSSIEIKDASLAEQRFRVRMHVQNPNGRALPIRGISYTIELAGEELGRGVTADAFTVPAFGEAEFEMLVTTNLATTFWKVLPRLKDSAHPAEYRLVGKVNTDLAFLHTIPFDEKGQFPVH